MLTFRSRLHATALPALSRLLSGMEQLGTPSDEFHSLVHLHQTDVAYGTSHIDYDPPGDEAFGRARFVAFRPDQVRMHVWPFQEGTIRLTICLGPHSVYDLTIEIDAHFVHLPDEFKGLAYLLINDGSAELDCDNVRQENAFIAFIHDKPRQLLIKAKDLVA